jgi:hypothetical protein
VAGDCLGRRADRARIDQLAGGEALGIGKTRAHDRAADDGNDVGARGADVDEQRVGMKPGDGVRRCRPVRRGNGQGGLARFVDLEEAPVHRKHSHEGGREGRRHGIEHEGDALALRPEHLG